MSDGQTDCKPRFVRFLETQLELLTMGRLCSVALLWSLRVCSVLLAL